jgi:dTDP-4-dehydrorhamnose 3,5-epimerase
VKAGGARAVTPRIHGVRLIELGNVITRSGFMTEIFRTDWPGAPMSVRQINWVQLNPGAVTDWHMHESRIDHLVGVGGNVKLALWDDRADSTSKGVTEIYRLGAARPIMVIVPPGVWHGLRNESGQATGYINVTDNLYDYEDPDNWRLKPDAEPVQGLL